MFTMPSMTMMVSLFLFCLAARNSNVSSFTPPAVARRVVAMTTTHHHRVSSSLLLAKGPAAKEFESAPVTSIYWKEMCERLKEYKEKHGDCNVPSTYADAQLSVWVRYLRKNHARLAQPGFEARRNALDKIGFDWGSA